MNRRNLSYRLIIALCVTILTTGCNTAKVSVADAQMSRGEYHEAAQTYRKIYNNLKNQKDRKLRGEVAKKLADCEKKLGRFARASVAYRNAIRYGAGDSLLLDLGRSLQADGKYQAAIQAYKDYIEKYGENDAARIGISGSTDAMTKNTPRTRYRVSPAKFINSRRSEYSPFLTDDPPRIFFTTTNENVEGAARSRVTGIKRGDIWTAKKDEHGRWLSPEPIKGEVNTEFDEGTPSISPDGQTMYFSRAVPSESGHEKVRIFVSKRRDAEWSEPIEFELIHDSLHNYAHPSIDLSGRYLYFTSDRPGGYGKTDIWRINLNSPKAVPENLGPNVNTNESEMFPSAINDSLLYFSSDGHPGFGGLDIFVSRLQTDGTRLTENMGLPINSAGDDFGMTFERDKQKGFFSSNRGDARGYDNIYTFELPDLKINISGTVTDLEEEPIAGATIRIVGRDGSNRMTRTRNDGTFDFPLERGVEYAMLAGGKGYLNARQEFQADTTEEDAEYRVDFILASLTQPNVLENIFYDFDKATLRPESAEALDGLVKLLNDNVGVKVELSAHTDRKGTDAYNDKLSERRAKSVVDYLITKGIDPKRLSWKGYGKTQPKRITRRIAREYPQFEEGIVLDEAFLSELSEEDQEAADQINRRTEFKVTGIEQW